MQVSKSNKLANVCYDIRGPVLKHAKRLEEEGHRILKLNIGNPAPFGFEAPDEILQDVIRNLPTAQGYSDSKGLFSARKAVMQYYQQKQVEGVGIEDILEADEAIAAEALDPVAVQRIRCIKEYGHGSLRQGGKGHP